jgi:hypothetical protein
MRLNPPLQRLVLALGLVAGLFTAPQATRAQLLSSNQVYTTMQPCRLFDSRVAGGRLVGGVNRTFNAVGVAAFGSLNSQGGNPGGCPVPGFTGSGPQVQAIAVNIAAVGPSATGVLQAWPSDQSKPNASVLNFTAAESVIANAILLPVRQDVQGGDITLVSNVGTDVIGDVVGYFTSVIHSRNVAVGGALVNLTTGQDNTAIGVLAVPDVTTSSDNTVVGSGAFFGMSASGSDANTAMGTNAFFSMTGGDHNIGLGHQAGYYLTTGSYNIYIGLMGSNSITSESGTIRIGDPAHQSNTFIAGIYNGNAVGGSQVFATSSGAIGTLSSSLRFKEDVEDMGSASADLMKLRPVVFRYRAAYDDGTHQLQYGLIAEEVAKIYPGLVQYDEEGLPRSIRYHFLNPMLLNEVQKQRAELDGQAATIAAQSREIAQQQAAIGDLRSQLESLRLQLQEFTRQLGANPAAPRPTP